MAVTTPFMGLRGTDQYLTDIIPESFREQILWLYPTGRAPLTGLTGKMPSKSLDSTDHNYWVQSLAEQGGAVTDIYDDEAMTDNTISDTAAAGHTLFIKMPETQTKGLACVGEFREGHDVAIRYSADSSVDEAGVVTKVVRNGASSYIAVRLLELAAVAASGNGLSDADEVYIMGSANPEGGAAVGSINYNPKKFSTKTQIFKNSINLTKTALAVAARAGLSKEAKLKDARRIVAELHAVEMERAFMFGTGVEEIGDNGQPMRRLTGLFKFLRTYYSAQESSYKYAAAYSGKTWLQGGYDWFESTLPPIFRYGAMNERVGFCGDLAFVNINKLIRSLGWEELKPETKVFGARVYDWLSPSGLIHLWPHPLFNIMPSMRKSMFLYDPNDVEYRPLAGRDTKLSDISIPGVDDVREEYLTECTIEAHFPEKMGLLHGIGDDNAV
uniref:Putative capsid protein n=1 Tax=viral metagenome TaxID=1070528 RepID=A0A6M3KRM9_9ZZZZ